MISISCFSKPNNTRRLFILDGLGAVVSAGMLGFVLVRYEDTFGIPSYALYFLAIFPMLFALYDLYCFRNMDNNWSLWLRRLSIMNILYCMLSIGMAFYHAAALTNLGWLYILVEVTIVLYVALVEWHVAMRLDG